MFRTRWKDVLQARLRSVSVLFYYVVHTWFNGLLERLIANNLVRMIFVLGLGMCFGNWKQTGVVYCFPN